MDKPPIAFLHYSAPPVVGGVEAVIDAHARAFTRAGYPVSVLAGRGERAALPAEVDWIQIPEMDSAHPEIRAASLELEAGRIPPQWDELTGRLQEKLAARLSHFPVWIAHNLFSKHFNLPLTAALVRLLDGGVVSPGIAWCHDFTWTSPRSASLVHAGYPWDLLRRAHPRLRYVTISRARRKELAALLGCPQEEIRVIYNGVDPQALLRLKAETLALVSRLDLEKRDLFLLLPVRVTRAKNLELAVRVAAALREIKANPLLLVTGPPDPHGTDSREIAGRLRDMVRDLGLEDVFRFVYRLGPDPKQIFTIDQDVVTDLLRLADGVFLTSHGEGYGMPVVEAGLMGVPVLGSQNLPAVVETGGQDVFAFDDEAQTPAELARKMVAWLENLPTTRLRRRVRQGYSWQAIFNKDILPLLPGTQPGSEE